jgi:hypothetical protein
MYCTVDTICTELRNTNPTLVLSSICCKLTCCQLQIIFMSLTYRRLYFHIEICTRIPPSSKYIVFFCKGHFYCILCNMYAIFFTIFTVFFNFEVSVPTYCNCPPKDGLHGYKINFCLCNKKKIYHNYAAQTYFTILLGIHGQSTGKL